MWHCGWEGREGQIESSGFVTAVAERRGGWMAKHAAGDIMRPVMPHLVLLSVLLMNVVVPQLIRLLARGNDVEPIAQLLLLEVLLGEVFEVPLR